MYLGCTITDTCTWSIACMLSTLLYGSKTWTLCAHQEWKLNTFHLHCLRHLLSMFMLLKQGQTEDEWIPKKLPYGNLQQGTCLTARPQLCNKDVCKRDIKTLQINIQTWEATDWKKGLIKFNAFASKKGRNEETETPPHTYAENTVVPTIDDIVQFNLDMCVQLHSLPRPTDASTNWKTSCI